MRRLMLFVGAVAATVVAASGASGSADQAKVPAARGVLVVETSGRVRILSPAGKRLPVPTRLRTSARLRASPAGLSPDTLLIAQARGDAVLLGPVLGGSMTTVERGSCRSCPYGADPSYAWSPDARRLAVAANHERGATSLGLSDRSGQAVRSFTLPRTSNGARVYHHLVAWSPDASRLLLLQTNDYGPAAVVVLDVGTGHVRTLARLGSCDSPLLSWSPDGRLVALTSEGTQDCPDRFDVLEAGSARAVVRCSDTPPGCTGGTAWMPGGTVWAADGRSVFGSVFTEGSRRIDRFYLTGRRTSITGPKAGALTPQVAFGDSLVYQVNPTHGRSVLSLLRLATGHDETLVTSAAAMTVVPLVRLP